MLELLAMDDVVKLPERNLPPLLAQIPDAPEKLFVRGQLPSFELSWLTGVGSRAMSAYGKQVCKYLIEGLQGYPVVVVSGLAFGVHAMAHRCAVEVGLPTVSIPGSGLGWDVLYPRANVALAREILKAGGALLSEFEPKQKAADYTFPQRNRIMAGISKATLVIEAREKSGSLITARLATEYNRDLLVVPGSIFSDGSRGTHQFLKLGAIPVTSPEDVLRALGINPKDQKKDVSDLSITEKKVLELINDQLSREALITSLKLSITEANVLLSSMEIKGLIYEEFGVVRKI